MTSWDETALVGYFQLQIDEYFFFGFTFVLCFGFPVGLSSPSLFIYTPMQYQMYHFNEQ